MAKILDREATIKTAVVEIKALTVSGRQVTQSLFKQLQEERLIDEESLNLRGVPWGRVNYHVGCAPEVWGDHLHIVWEIGGELRRSCVYEGWGEHLATRVLRYAESWREAAAIHGVQEEEPLINGKPASKYDFTGGRSLLEVKGVRVPEWPAASSTSWLWDKTRPSRPQLINWIIEEVNKHHKLPEGWEQLGWDGCIERFNRYRDKAEQIETRWAELYTSLQALDQLFIAV